jgi:hypothetical protein
LVTSDLMAANEIPGRRIHQLIGVEAEVAARTDEM